MGSPVSFDLKPFLPPAEDSAVYQLTGLQPPQNGTSGLKFDQNSTILSGVPNLFDLKASPLSLAVLEADKQLVTFMVTIQQGTVQPPRFSNPPVSIEPVRVGDQFSWPPPNLNLSQTVAPAPPRAYQVRLEAGPAGLPPGLQITGDDGVKVEGTATVEGEWNITRKASLGAHSPFSRLTPTSFQLTSYNYSD